MALIIGAMDRTERYEDIPAAGLPLIRVIMRFYGFDEERTAYEKVSGQSVRYNSKPVGELGGIEKVTARDGDFVSIYPEEVNQGGVRGALYG